MKLARRITLFLLCLAICFFLLFIPLAMIAKRGFFGAEPFRLSPLLWPVLKFTVFQASLSVGTSLVLGGAYGFFFARTASVRCRGILLSVFSLPSLTIVGGSFALAQFLGASFGLPLVIAAHAFLNAPWIALAVIESVETFPSQWTLSARSLGADSRQVFWKLILPWVSVRLGMASAQVFAFCVMSFAIVLLLGGGPPVSTLETEIYAQVRGGGLALSGAAQFAFAQLLLAGLPLFIVSFVRRKQRIKSKRVMDTVSHSRPSEPAGAGATIVASIWLALPILVLVLGFLGQPEFFKGDLWRAIRQDGELRSALTLSFGLAAATAFTALLFAFAFIRAPFLASIPIGLSPLVLCLGFFLAYSGGLFQFFDPFEGSRVAIVLLEAVLLVPFGLRFFQPIQEESVQASRRDLLWAARSLGATASASWWKLEWPHYRKAVGDFLRLAFVWSFMDVAIASFFSSEDFVTLPVWIAMKMSRYEFLSSQVVLFGASLFSILILLSGRRSRRVES